MEQDVSGKIKGTAAVLSDRLVEEEKEEEEEDI